ncbi:MAG: phasin family protein [Thermoanaerobaculia bacterium]
MATKKQTEQDFKEEIKQNAEKVWLAGLGALATAEEEGGKLFRGLMKKGESYEKKGLAQFDKLKAKVEGVAETAKDRAGEAWGKVEDKVVDVEDKLDDRVAVVLRKIGVPSKNEIATLTRRVEELTLLVEKKLKPTRKVKRATPATRKTTTARRKR